MPASFPAPRLWIVCLRVVAALTAALMATAGLADDLGPRAGAHSAKTDHKAVPSMPSKSGRASPGVVGVVAGSLGETEFRVANEIAAAVASAQESGPNGEVPLRVVPIVSKGGAQTVRDLLTLPEADFGIAPALVLERLQAESEFRNLKNRISYIAPLYVEEVHLLAGPMLKSFGDLQGKLVSVGEDGSEAEIIARELLNAAGVQVREVHLGLQDALAAIKSNEISATFVVSGKPVDALKTLSHQDGLQLLALPQQVPPEFLPSVISAEDYPDLIAPGEQIETLAVQSILFAYNWPTQSPRGQLDQFFLKGFLWRLPDLQLAARHPKWKEVNVAGSILGWRRLPSMETWLKKVPQPGGNDNLRAEFDVFLSRNASRAAGANREALFRDYLRWRKDPMTTGSR